MRVCGRNPPTSVEEKPDILSDIHAGHLKKSPVVFGFFGVIASYNILTICPIFGQG